MSVQCNARLLRTKPCGYSLYFPLTQELPGAPEKWRRGQWKHTAAGRMPLHGAATEHSRPAASGTTSVNPNERPISLGQHRKLSALTPRFVTAGGGGQGGEFRLFNETLRPPKYVADGCIQHLLKADQKPSSPRGVCMAPSNTWSGPITCIHLKTTVPQS